MSLVVLKTGTKIPSLVDTAGDYEQWIAAGMGAERFDTVDVAAGEPLPPPTTPTAVAITGSGAMVTDDAPWIAESAAWLRQAIDAGVPVLGICFGHQLLAHALGGEVGYNPRGVEVGSVELRLTAAAQTDPLFHGLPERLPAQVSHRQSVLRLPAGARLLAASAMEPHQAFAWGERVWGLQFHPEFDDRIIGHFIEHYRTLLEEGGHSAEALLAARTPTPRSREPLTRFGGLYATDGESP